MRSMSWSAAVVWTKPGETVLTRTPCGADFVGEAFAVGGECGFGGGVGEGAVP
jgi:hypothetical protein